MSSEVEICNRALQKLGAKRITSLTEDSVNARHCNVAYEPVRDSELRSHVWSFAISRSALAADATAPSFGRARAFTLPADFLRILPPYPEDNFNSRDWVIEGRKIYTDDSAPLNIRYVRQVTDPNEMDPAFREALAAKLAAELCEVITQSGAKWERAMADYKAAIIEARRTNAIEKVPESSTTDTWITVRS